MNTSFTTIGTAKLILLYLGCYAVVVAYVNTFIIWTWLRSSIGSLSGLLPIGAVLVLATMATLLLISLQKKGAVIKKWWIIATVVSIAIALCLPDPDLPAKRIHVAQYSLLALLVRYPLSCRLHATQLTFFTFLVTVLFGIHDELIQGLHPLRTFGLRDICVNGFAALGGACLGHGVELFSANSRKYHRKEKGSVGPVRQYLYSMISLIILTVLTCMLVPLPHFAKSSIPLWLVSPLMGCLCGAALMAPEIARQRPAEYHGLQVVFWMLLLLPTYLVIANVALVEFN